MYYSTVWNTKLKRTQDLNCPEFLRISDGPRWLIKKIPWAKNQKFYKILDLDTGNEFFMTSTEARVHCGIARDSFRSRMNSKKRKRNLIKERYLVHRIPKLIFIRNTGRKTDEQKRFSHKF